MAARGALDLELDAMRARLDDLEQALGALLDAGSKPADTKKKEPTKAQKEPK